MVRTPSKNGVVIRTSCPLSNGDLSNQNDRRENHLRQWCAFGSLWLPVGFFKFLGAGHLGSAAGTTAWRVLERRTHYKPVLRLSGYPNSKRLEASGAKAKLVL